MIMDNLQQKVDALKWFHTIDLGNGIVTKGEVGEDHCSEYAATNRFGIPEDLSGKSVLDTGANNGYFSFLAEGRGAFVTAIEPDANLCEGFELARTSVGGHWPVVMDNLSTFVKLRPGAAPFDITFLFGVLYHVEDPIGLLRDLYAVTKSYALIETAISQTGDERPMWEFLPGHNGDSTNMWYPTYGGLATSLKYVGFTDVQVIWTDGIRMSVRAWK